MSGGTHTYICVYCLGAFGGLDYAGWYGEYIELAGWF